MSRYAIRSSLAALGFIVAAAGMSGAAMAAADTAPTSAQATHHDGKRGDRHGHQHHRGHFKHGDRHGYHGLRDGFFVPGVGPLSKTQIESLKLDAKQQSAFDAAKTAQGDFFKSMRENGGKRHELLATQLKNGKLDPHALIADEDAQRSQMREQSGQVRGKWLAAWDSLNSTQHQQVTDWVKERQAKMQAHRAKKQERMAARAAKAASDTATSAAAAPAQAN